MALFVLAFALALTARAPRRGRGGAAGWRLARRASCLLLAAASVFTFSVPGLAWFVIALPVWLAFEALAGRSPVDWSAVRARRSRAHRVALAVAALILIGVAVVAFAPAREFASKIADVQDSAGRLSSPVFGGEALGIWPAGDFRIVRGEVSGSLLAVALGALARRSTASGARPPPPARAAGDAGHRRRSSTSAPAPSPRSTSRRRRWR